MKIGFSNVYSWSPHLAYTKKMYEDLRKDNECVYFYCGGMQSACYDKVLRQLNLLNCLKCQTKQLTRFGINSSLKSHDNKTLENKTYNIDSTIASILRLSAPEKSEEFKSLHKEITISCRRLADKFRVWLRQQSIDFMIVFNGRFDLTRAMIEVLEEEKIPFLTHERSWFGTGINLNWNKNCLSLDKFRNFSHDTNTPLTLKLFLAKLLVAPRFDASLTSNEWKRFNHKSLSTFKNLSSDKLNILYLPSSPSEFLFESGWESEFQNVNMNVRILSELFSRENLIIKGHPIWDQKIQSLRKPDINSDLENFCRKNEIKYISSMENIDVNKLIEDVDVVITSGSSSALQAGIKGKLVCNLGPCEYSWAGFVNNVTNFEDLRQLTLEAHLSSAEIRKRTLLFIYAMSFEKMQFSDKLYLNNSRDLQCSSQRVISTEHLNKMFMTDDYRPSFRVPKGYSSLNDDFRSDVSIQDFLQLR